MSDICYGTLMVMYLYCRFLLNKHVAMLIYNVFNRDLVIYTNSREYIETSKVICNFQFIRLFVRID